MHAEQPNSKGLPITELLQRSLTLRRQIDEIDAEAEELRGLLGIYGKQTKGRRKEVLSEEEKQIVRGHVGRKSREASARLNALLQQRRELDAEYRQIQEKLQAFSDQLEADKADDEFGGATYSGMMGRE